MWYNGLSLFLFPHRNKAILFYFNILHCANPAVLINLQCPTRQVSEARQLCLFISCQCVPFSWKETKLFKAIKRITELNTSPLYLYKLCQRSVEWDPPPLFKPNAVLIKSYQIQRLEYPHQLITQWVGTSTGWCLINRLFCLLGLIKYGLRLRILQYCVGCIKERHYVATSPLV